MSSSNRVIVAMLAVVVLAVAFWMLLLSPKKEEVSKLDKQVAKQEEQLLQHQSEVQQGLASQKAFPSAYRDLIVLGKAAPVDDDTASLIVQLSRNARSAGVRFETFLLAPNSGGEGEAPEPAPAPEPGQPSSFVPPTEVAASTMPIGASIGPAGLAVMPYTLTFKGSFFHVADFIHGLDSLVHSNNEKVEVTGRLITINAFTLTEDTSKRFPALQAEFTVTTFLVPPEQGVTGGATPTSPEPSTTQVSTTIGGTP
ncbi:MAG TPA: type II secretion system protein GspM [Solirubrobacterales bacterium]|nr:type II secretion system protein GspM [Solirubrobacterales bacterium]